MINLINPLIIGNIEFKFKTNATLLGLLIDEKPSFKQHLDALCQKSNFKTNVLKPIRSYLNTESSEAIHRFYNYSNFLKLSTDLDIWI